MKAWTYVERAVVHPLLGPLIVLAIILILGANRFGIAMNWLIVNLSGLFALALGIWIARIISDKIMLHLAVLSISEISAFFVLATSLGISRGLGPLIPVLWFIVLNLSAYVTLKANDVRSFFSLIVFAGGSVLVLYSYLSHGGWTEIREMPLIPLEGALGLFLLFISYPKLLLRVWERRRSLCVPLIAIAILLSISHGFRADTSLIILSTVLVTFRKSERPFKQIFLLFTILILSFVIVGRVRGGLQLDPLGQITYRFSTTYFYSAVLSDLFLEMHPPFPLWVTQIPLHPSQTIGRGIFSKGYGITPTIFVGMLVDAGLLGMLILSLLIGFVSGYSYRLLLEGGRDMLSYNIMWPILVTRAEIGLSQLDLAMIFGSATYPSLANLINGSKLAPSGAELCPTTTTDP